MSRREPVRNLMETIPLPVYLSLNDPSTMTHRQHLDILSDHPPQIPDLSLTLLPKSTLLYTSRENDWAEMVLDAP